MSIFNLYQELSKTFLGVTLGDIKKLQELHPHVVSNMDVNAWTPLIAQQFYYQLERSDPKFNEKFRSNIALSKKKQDEDYCEYLQLLVQQINPDLVDSVHMWDPKLDMNSFNIKPKPKIVPKAKPKKLKKNSYKDRTEPNKYLLSDALKKFFEKDGLVAPDKLIMADIKIMMNRYISQHNLQSMSHKTHILLNKDLELLFIKELEKLHNPAEISYIDLKKILKQHLVADSTQKLK